MPGARKALGVKGETLAQKYLSKLGYRILENNFRCQYGEIDIVAQQGDTLVFVEVKTRRTRSFGVPEEAITPLKAEKLIQAAETYRQEKEGLPADYRIDVVVVRMEPGMTRPQVRLLRNAVEVR